MAKDAEGEERGGRSPRREGGRDSGSGGGTRRQSRPANDSGGRGRNERDRTGGGERARPDRRGHGDETGTRPPSRESRPDRPPEPDLPEDVEPHMLDRDARARLRTLGKTNADLAARHLVMAGRLIDEDPQRAYEHAQAAQRRAGRVDVVREAVALTAYATDRYAEALRELRTVRRLSGSNAHRPVEADCERGLGRPERALAIVAETDVAALPEEDRVELAIVASGARADLGEHEAGLVVLEGPLVPRQVSDVELRRRLDLVRADRLEELGRTEQAAALRAAAGPDLDDDDVLLMALDVEEQSEGTGGRAQTS
ncbi:hypothetical protein GCM10023169_17880 [Georgenia halophila]|uniref:DUF222 domain-containing protein n=1 Tax=Georgenia halophila TaxID=620889 RepID=A0ABP8L612_9MICO